MIKHLYIVFIITLTIGMHAQENKSAVVLELFTSQGCSSCPPADVLLDDIKNRYKDQQVFVLSYHVDYWNRLGWKDPFSTADFTEYQRSYAQQFSSRSIYTPQLVVNGSEHFTGSNEYKAKNALKRYGASGVTHAIELKEVKKQGATIELQYQVEGGAFDTITLALVVAERITDISRGENRNRTLKNSNIVANRIVVQEGQGHLSITIPDWVEATDQLSIIAYTQDRDLKTTGATEVRL